MDEGHDDGAKEGEYDEDDDDVRIPDKVLRLDEPASGRLKARGVLGGERSPVA